MALQVLPTSLTAASCSRCCCLSAFTRSRFSAAVSSCRELGCKHGGMREWCAGLEEEEEEEGGAGGGG